MKAKPGEPPQANQGESAEERGNKRWTTEDEQPQERRQTIANHRRQQ